jgi:anti-sigma factor RsiW
MHSVVMENLEEYLEGALPQAVLQEVEAHLAGCGQCREDVAGMQQTSAWLTSLRADEAVAPALGFYARVVRQVEEQQLRPAFTSWFSLDLAFARRLAFTSLMLLAVLGSYLVSRETSYSSGPTGEVVMAQDSNPALAERDNILVTLTSYEP